MSCEYTVADDERRQQAERMSGLQRNKDKATECPVDEKLQISLCPYLVLMAGCEVVSCAHDEQQKQISEHAQLPRMQLLKLKSLFESCQFYERAIEQLHPVVEESMPEE